MKELNPKSPVQFREEEEIRRVLAGEDMPLAPRGITLHPEGESGGARHQLPRTRNLRADQGAGWRLEDPALAHVEPTCEEACGQ